MQIEQIRTVVLRALENTNLTRDPAHQLTVSLEAPIFGPASSLDSLGLVALLIDIEEALQDAGCDITFSDGHAMSETHSPFRDVPTLVDYVARRLESG